jgi:hypothetical protein
MSSSAGQCLATAPATLPTALADQRLGCTCTSAREWSYAAPETGRRSPSSGNNLPHLDIPPSYTNDWGFTDGAQNNVFVAAATPAPVTGITNPRATPTNGAPSK